MAGKAPAPRNRTIRLSDEERSHYRAQLLTLTAPTELNDIINRTICQDIFQAVDHLPDQFVDLLFVDPPYNLTKQFNQRVVKRRSPDDYADWVDSWLSRLVRLLKPTASVYLCGDWQSSAILCHVASRYLHVRNRITWEREKGRSARANWKNCSEDIWFCTRSQHYYFDASAVQLKRRVVAPYTTASGDPKDWERSSDGNFRLTAASNVWTDLTVPFWSMPENTDHPTQKPEKLLAKVILASSAPDAVVFDPFLGSGTTSVVAKKLGRQFVGVELDDYYACLAEKRLAQAEHHRAIQGYSDRVFWERNTLPQQKAAKPSS